MLKYLNPLLKYSFLFLTFFLLNNVAAQNTAKAPGYQGKRVSIHYELKPSLWLWGDNAKSIYEEMGNIEKEQNYTFRHNLSIHFATSKSSSTGIDFISNFGPRYYRSEEGDHDELRSVTGAEIGISYKYGLGGSILPLGNYFEMRPFTFFGKYEVLGRYFGDTYLPYPEPLESDEYKYTGYGLSLNFGKQWIIADRIIPSYVFGTTMHLFFLNGKTDGQREAYRQFMGNFFDLNFITFDFKLGVGILLF